MKLLLTSFKNEITEIDVSPDDLADTLRLKLIEKSKVPAEYSVKLVCSKELLQLDKKISEQKVVIKDGSKVIYFSTKKKLESKRAPVLAPVPAPVPVPADNRSNSSSTTTSTSSIPMTSLTSPTATTLTTPATTVAPLPATFNGVSMDMFRQFVMVSVVSRVLSTPQLLREILMQDPKAAIIRSSNPGEFDRIISHPGLLSMNLLHPDVNEDDQMDQNTFVNQTNQQPWIVPAGGRQPTESEPGQMHIALTQDEKEFIDEVKKMAPNVSSSEIIQYYLANNRDKDITVNMVLNMSQENYGDL
jgi:hypothetical protein